MANMHVLYAHEMSLTFRIESLTPAERWAQALREDEMITVFHAASSVVESVLIKDLVHNPTLYQNRGWCIGEMEWSSDRQETAQNQLIDIRSDTARQQGELELLARVPTSPEHFAEKMDTAEFTHRSDAPAVVHLQEKIFFEKVKRNESLNLEGLPGSEMHALAHALPYFEVLQTIALVHFECSQEEAEAFAKVGFWNPLTLYPSFQATWFKASNSLPSIDDYMIQALVTCRPCTTLVFAHHAHPNPKGCRKVIELCFILTPRSKGPKSDPKAQVQFLLWRPCDKRRCWSFAAGPTTDTTRASILWSRQGEGHFQVRALAYICQQCQYILSCSGFIIINLYINCIINSKVL